MTNEIYFRLINISACKKQKERENRFLVNMENNRTSTAANSSSNTNITATTTANSSTTNSSTTSTASATSTSSSVRQSHKRTFSESDSSSRTERHLCSFSHLWIIK